MGAQASMQAQNDSNIQNASNNQNNKPPSMKSTSAKVQTGNMSPRSNHSKGGNNASVRSYSRVDDPNKSFFSNHSDELIYFLMPIYFTGQPLTPHEKGKAISAFREIAQNRSSEFTRLKKEYPFLVCQTPTEFFGNQFFRRLLEVHPTCGPLFKNSTMKQGGLLVKFLAMVIENLDNEQQFHDALMHLTQIHNEIGIKAMEYGIFGEVLFYSLRLCLGLKVYDSVTHAGWTKIYSKMLSVIIPEVVRYEMYHKEDFLAVKNSRLMTEVPRYSGAIILSGDANAPISSMAARGKNLHILSVDNPAIAKKDLTTTTTTTKDGHNEHAASDLKPGIDSTDHLAVARDAHAEKMELLQQQQQLLLREQQRTEDSIQRSLHATTNNTMRSAHTQEAKDNEPVNK